MAITSPETTRGIIPPQVWSFYDPNEAFASSTHPEDALFSWLDSKRETPITLPHVGAVATRQLVAMELSHAGIITRENTATHGEWLDIPVGQVEQSVEAAQTYADDTARFCLDAVTQLKRGHSQALRQTSDITLAGAVLSANAHKGQTRVVGNRPYYTHPRDVALLLNASYKARLTADSGLSLPLLDIEALLHDGLENAFPRDGSSFLTSPNVITSPLVVYETLLQLDVPEDVAKARAIGILGLTNTMGPNGRMHYWPYIMRFSAYPEQIPTKQADLQHNYKIDPKIPLLGNDADVRIKNHKIFLKNNLYYDAQQYLLAEYSKSDEITEPDWFGKQFFAARIPHLTRQDLKQTHAATPWANISSNELVETYERAVAA